MINFGEHKNNIDLNGFTIIDNVFTHDEAANIISVINDTVCSDPVDRRVTGLFAIRRFFTEIPRAVKLTLNEKLLSITESLFGDRHFVVKSIYFDKPPQSNWFVPYHQDLTIAVNRKVDLPGFNNWTVKQDQFAVQPPLQILENNFTIRIHLDDTDENNGALKVIPGSHRKGICRSGTTDHILEKEIVCRVKKGGVMIMRPLLMHASNKAVNHRQRRVIHIEFSNAMLPGEIQWSEYIG